MKKQISLLSPAIVVIQTYAIDSSGYGLEYGKRGINIPSLLLLIGMVIAIIGCF